MLIWSANKDKIAFPIFAIAFSLSLNTLQASRNWQEPHWKMIIAKRVYGESKYGHIFSLSLVLLLLVAMHVILLRPVAKCTSWFDSLQTEFKGKIRYFRHTIFSQAKRSISPTYTLKLLFQWKRACIQIRNAFWRTANKEKETVLVDWLLLLFL